MENAPVFVKIDDYRDVLEVVSLLKDKLAQARKTLDTIHDLRAKEAHELEEWSAALQEIDEKVEQIDKNLLEPQV